MIKLVESFKAVWLIELKEKIDIHKKVLRGVKSEDAEKVVGTFERPLIPFISEKSQMDDWDQKELLVNPAAADKRR